VDEKGLFIYSSSASERVLGYSSDELVGRKYYYDFFPPDLKNGLKEKAFSVFESKESFRGFVNPNVCKDGEIVFLETSGTPTIDNNGILIGYRGADTDITNRLRAEEAQRLLFSAIEQTAEGIIITDSIGIIQYVNPAEAAITGYNRDELIGRTPSIFKSDEHDEAFYWKIWETINAGNVWSGRFINKKKDGTEYHEDASISPVYDKSGNLTNFVAAKHDVTKEIGLQQQLLQAQKMEAIGTLTGGFAHDFNNLLQVIMGHLDVILSVPDLPEKIQSSLNNIDRAATSGAELIKGMLLYSKKMPFKLRPVNLSEIVASFVTLIRRTIPREIKIEIVVADDLPVIKGDSTQIEQVLINLAINARDAMPDGGGLTIETRTTVLDEEFCRSYPDLKPGRYVLLSVMDTGKGMDQETVKHIYDPFFTTKEPGKGTGLGLSVVHGIVEKHGGKIICYSDPSVGTTFRIYFPAIEVLE
jgi:PAS domain S-box-containing protein